MTTDGVYKVVQYYAGKIGIGDIERLGVHALRATAATNALDHEADIAKGRSGWGMRTSPPRGCTIAGRPARGQPDV